MGIVFFPAALGSDDLRIGLWNGDFSRKGPGVLIDELIKEPEILSPLLQVLDPLALDVFVLIDFDIDDQGWAARLASDAFGFRYFYQPPSNRGRPSGYDLNHDGRIDAQDRMGFGEFRGTRSIVIFSQLPITEIASYHQLGLREFMDIPAAEIGWNELPLTPTGLTHVEVGGVQILTSYAQNPAFDDKRGLSKMRNAAEIGFWKRYIQGEKFQSYQGATTGLVTPFILAAGLNLDPDKGAGEKKAIGELLAVQDIKNLAAASDLGLATADWRDRGIGALRVDYLLGSCELKINENGTKAIPDEPHRLLWVDVSISEGCE